MCVHFHILVIYVFLVEISANEFGLVNNETGGRWHVSIPPLVRCLAKEYLQRTPGLEDDALGAVVARWGARLSALLIRGNGAVVRAGGPPLAVSPHVDIIGNSGLHDLVPEGDCAYELLVS